MSRISKKTCCVYGCLQTKRTNPDCPFFSLPTDHERRIQWLKIIGRHDLISRSADLKPKSYFVCSLHFEECSLKLIRHLAPDAIPCRFLPDVIVSNPAEILQIANSSIDWDDIILNQPQASTSMIPKSQPPNQNTQIVPTNSNTLIIPGLHNDFSKNFYKLIEEKLKILKDGYRYSKEFLFYALNMYILNPQAYCFISEDLYLPDEREIRNMKLKLSPKLDNRVLDCLSSKLKSLPEKAKYCTVCIKSMLLKSNLYYDMLNDELVGLQDINGSKVNDCASAAYIMMLRGILVKWDQPVSYCFLGDLNNYHQLDSWITGVITKLQKIGFEVMAVVSNDSNMNRYAKYIKDISTKKTSFKVNDKKIYYILEFPHLLKSLRNNVLTNDLYYNEEKRASWEYIELLFSLENRKKYKLAPKLSSSHIRPDNLQKLSVALASDVFSKSVSNAIHTYVDLKIMPEQARPTADFCLFLNDLFDVLNSRTYKNENIYKCALGTDDSQITLITDAPTVFDSMTCKSLGKKVKKPPIRSTKTITNIQVSLRSIVSLVKDLHDLGHKLILTERFTLEPLDKFMDLLKRVTSKSNKVVKLTPVKFSRNFSKLFLKYIITKSPHSNRPKDFEKFVQDASQLTTNRIDPIPCMVSLVALNGETDYRITLPEDFPTIYVASYLFYKCEGVHKCAKLKVYAKTLPDLAKTQVYNAYNQKAEFYGKLKLLHLPFIQYIEKLEKSILLQLQNVQRVLCWELGAGLLKALTNVPFESPPCNCFPTNYMMRLLIRLRIYATVKDYNEVLKRDKTSLSEYLLNLLPE